MEGLNNDGQWIVMMGLLVSVGIFFLALIINQSTLVGQTTAEGVLEFPKNDIQDIRHTIIESVRDPRNYYPNYPSSITAGVTSLAMARKGAVVSYRVNPPDPLSICGSWSAELVTITYNNGVTEYEETTCIEPYGGSP